jgi:predicted oxidoreductase
MHTQYEHTPIEILKLMGNEETERIRNGEADKFLRVQRETWFRYEKDVKPTEVLDVEKLYPEQEPVKEE